MNTTTIAQDIAAYIHGAARIPDDETIDPDTNLVSLGLMTSMITTEVIGYVKRRYSVSIGFEYITADNFRTAESIADLIVASEKGE